MLTTIRHILIVLFVGTAVIVAERKSFASEADDEFAVAAAHYDRQDWKLAVEEFRSFVAKHPKDPRATDCAFFLGEALRQVGEYGEARRQYQIYSNLAPKGNRAPAALFGAGEAAYLAGDMLVAKADLTQFTKKYPHDRLNAFALPYLGEIALSSDDTAAAIAHFRRGLTMFPGGRSEDDCRLGLARALERQGQKDEAEQLYLSVSQKNDSHVADVAQFHLGALEYAAGRYDDALKSFAVFEGRLAKSPWQANARLGAGMVLLKLRRPDDAIKKFDAVLESRDIDADAAQQAIRGKIEAALQKTDYATVDRETAQFEKQFPKGAFFGDVRRLLARSLVERKAYAKAIAALDSLIGTNPVGRMSQTDLENRYLLAVSYEGLKRYEDALASLLPVVDDAKGQLRTDARLTHGTVLLAMKKYSEAIAPLEEFLAEKPTGDVRAKALGELAICYARTKQLDKAKKLHSELIKNHAGLALIAPTTEHLAEAAYDANDTAWASELSKQLAELGASAEYEAKGKLNLGWSQFKAGKLDEAATTFDELLQSGPPPAIGGEAAMTRGRILQELGQTDAALATYDLAIERYPKADQHADVLLAAARLRNKARQPELAAKLYERLAKDHPRFSKGDAALYEWAWLKQELGKPDEAAGLFERLRTEHPNSPLADDAACRLAQRALNAKDFSGADKLIVAVLNRKAEAAGPAEVSDPKVRQYAMLLRGQIAMAKADWPKSREAFEAMIREYPESQRRALAEYCIADAYYHEGDYTAALKRLERLAQQLKGKREPWMAMIALRQAQSLAQQNEWTDAFELASMIEKNYPNFEQQYEVDYLLGRCLAMKAEFDAARQMYKKVIRSPISEKTETAAMAQWMIGESYFHQKSYKAAAKEYQQLEVLYAYPTWQAASLLQAGKCRERLGENDEAVRLYRRVVKVYHDTSFAKDAAQELARLEGATSRH